MRVHDISVPIRPGMIVYDGNPGVHIERVDSIAKGAHANISRIDLGAHTGTHVDAPLHFFEDGAGSESIDPGALVGPAQVVDATSADSDFDEEALVRVGIPEAERVLLKTSNCQLWARESFTRDFIRLTGSGARYLIDRGVRVIGIDYLSIGDAEAHRELLSAGVIPVEGLDLREIEPGRYQFICLPLRLEGSDGAPCRALLIEE